MSLQTFFGILAIVLLIITYWIFELTQYPPLTIIGLVLVIGIISVAIYYFTSI